MDQTYNTFLNEILIENKDCQLEWPGKGDRDIGSQDTLCADDPIATHDGTKGAVKYFYQCIHQLNADIENKSYKKKTDKADEIRKEKLLLKSINQVVPSSSSINENVTHNVSSYNQFQVEELLTISEQEQQIVGANNNSQGQEQQQLATSSSSIRSNWSSRVNNHRPKKEEKEKISPHKINLLNQKTNLDIALIEASNSEKALTVQEKELDIRRQQLELDSQQKQETNKLFSKVLDKFINKKESSQDIFICLKT